MTIEIFNDCIKKLDNWLVEAKQSSMEGKEVFFFFCSYYFQKKFTPYLTFTFMAPLWS